MFRFCGAVQPGGQELGPRDEPEDDEVVGLSSEMKPTVLILRSREAASRRTAMERKSSALRHGFRVPRSGTRNPCRLGGEQNRRGIERTPSSSIPHCLWNKAKYVLPNPAKHDNKRPNKASVKTNESARTKW
jgi:hypothetical protein